MIDIKKNEMSGPESAKNIKKAGLDDCGLRPTAVRRRTAARLASIQVNYALEMTGHDIRLALPEFLEHFGPGIVGQLRVKKMDETHFVELATGISDDKTRLDEAISQCLIKGWSMSRLARHELYILRAGIYELSSMPHIPARSVISEYTGLAEVFQSDIGFINAILDRLARQFRVEEMGSV